MSGTVGSVATLLSRFALTSAASVIPMTMNTKIKAAASTSQIQSLRLRAGAVR